MVMIEFDVNCSCRRFKLELDDDDEKSLSRGADAKSLHLHDTSNCWNVRERRKVNLLSVVQTEQVCSSRETNKFSFV